MLKSIIARAVEAAFCNREFEHAVAEQVAFVIDYEAVAEEVLSEIDLEEMVQAAAVEHAIDILEIP